MAGWPQCCRPRSSFLALPYPSHAEVISLPCVVVFVLKSTLLDPMSDSPARYERGGSLSSHRSTGASSPHTQRAWLCCEKKRGRTRLLSRQRVPTTCLWLSRPMALAHLPTTAERLAPGSGPRDNASRSLDNGNRPAPLLPAGRPASATILTEKFCRPSCFRANHSSNMQQRG